MLNIRIEYEGTGDDAIAPLLEEVTTGEESGRTIIKGIINDQKGRNATVNDFAFYKIMVEMRYISERTQNLYTITGEDDKGGKVVFTSDRGKNSYSDR